MQARVPIPVQLTAQGDADMAAVAVLTSRDAALVVYHRHDTVLRRLVAFKVY